jgi:hypothetical protein
LSQDKALEEYAALMIALACRDAAGVPGVYRLGSRLGAHQENMRFIGVFVEVRQLNRLHSELRGFYFW